MNCCDYECNQGRDCPIRRTPVTEAKVARIGRRDYTREELPPSYWREQLKALGYWVGLALLGWLIWIPLLYLLLRA